ncbi:MAG: hypothetical protein H0W11_13330, partial [Gemmatimonadetes bacterium]|nr:hypothetical protein [Gemmatimonadota bacterium]
MRRASSGRNGRHGGNLAADVVKGAIAGAAGVWAMDRVGWWLWDQQDSAVLQQEREARVE